MSMNPVDAHTHSTYLAFADGRTDDPTSSFPTLIASPPPWLQQPITLHRPLPSPSPSPDGAGGGKGRHSSIRRRPLVGLCHRLARTFETWISSVEDRREVRFNTHCLLHYTCSLCMFLRPFVFFFFFFWRSPSSSVASPPVRSVLGLELAFVGPLPCRGVRPEDRTRTHARSADQKRCACFMHVSIFVVRVRWLVRVYLQMWSLSVPREGRKSFLVSC